MSEQVCSGSHYTCGEKVSWLTGGHGSGNIQHVRDKKHAFMLGKTEILIHESSREFSISYDHTWALPESAFLMRNSEGGLFLCGNATTDDHHSVSEDYRCTNTTLYFLDTRYDNAIGREIKEVLVFSETSTDLVGFKTVWGIQWLPKYVITNLAVKKTTTYFVVIGGVKTVLQSSETEETIYGPSNPLIIVWPNPESEAVPWLNCDDINQYGFYDYHAEGSQAQIQLDGGDDFYFTDWMRLIGAETRIQDQTDADTRYFEYYLGDEAGKTRTISYDNPGLSIDPTPVGSICRDRDGNVFYSITLDGKVSNFITGGNLTELFPETGDEPQFYPVGLA